ncbi:MAG: hypothetical protein AAF292_02520 [Pseudomonadota bacterium]
MTSCISSPLPSDGLTVTDVVSRLDSFERDEETKVCGWAANAFENSQVTSRRKSFWNSDENDVGLGVKWLKEAPQIKRARWRCITGLLEPNCGWDNQDDGPTETICISTATAFDWSIRQTSLDQN